MEENKKTQPTEEIEVSSVEASFMASIIERVHELEEENEALKNKIFEIEMAIYAENESYCYRNIIRCDDVIKYHSIIAADDYYTKPFIEAVNKYGYDKVNAWFLQKAAEAEEERIAKEEAAKKAEEADSEQEVLMKDVQEEEKLRAEGTE